MNITISFELRNVLKWILLSLAFLPLVTTSSTLFPLIFGKSAFIKLVLGLFFIVFTFHLYHSQKGGTRRIDFGRLRHPIFVTTVLFILVALIGIPFAENSYRAFFGDIERGEGFVMLFYMLLFFAGSLLLFQRKDWIHFFKLSLLSGAIIAGDIILQFAQGTIIVNRIGGQFIGSPAFVAAYMLFVLFSAFLVKADSKNTFWRVVTYTSILLSTVTIFITQARGVLVGLFVATVAVTLYTIFAKELPQVRILKRDIALRKMAVATLILIVLFAVIFTMTRDNDAWQSLPGFDRLARISLEDKSTQTRLINYGVSFNAVNPNNVGIEKTLLGWGIENYDIAYNQFYDPSIQKYEISWFDRAHNKLLDVLVMNGFLGLLIYLTLWGVLFKYIFQDRKKGWAIQTAMLLFGISYFIQNLFIFDHISTYIPFFAFLSYAAFNSPRAQREKIKEKYETVPLLFSGILSAILIISFVWLAAIPFYQMRLLASGKSSGGLGPVLEDLQRISTPYNYAQAEIRLELLSFVSRFANDPAVLEPTLAILALHEEAVSQAPLKPRALQFEGLVLTNIGKVSQSSEAFAKAEEKVRSAVELAPGKQEILVQLFNTLLAQGKIDEANLVINEMIALEPEGIDVKLFFENYTGAR